MHKLIASLFIPRVVLQRPSIIGSIINWAASRASSLIPSSLQQRTISIKAQELVREQSPIKGGRVDVHLPAPKDVYIRTVSIPKSNVQSHERMLALMLHSLAPSDPQTLMCAGITKGKSLLGGQDYVIAMVRNKTLERLSAMAKKRGAKEVCFVAMSDEGKQKICFYAPSDLIVKKARLITNLTLIVMAFGSLYWVGNIWSKQENTRLQFAKKIEARLSVEARKAITQERTDAAARAALAAAPLLRRPGKALLDISALNTLTPSNAYWRRAEWTPDSLTVQLNASDAADIVRTMAQDHDAFDIKVISDITATTANRQNVRIRAKARTALDAEQ